MTDMDERAKRARNRLENELDGLYDDCAMHFETHMKGSTPIVTRLKFARGMAEWLGRPTEEIINTPLSVPDTGAQPTANATAQAPTAPAATAANAEMDTLVRELVRIAGITVDANVPIANQLPAFRDQLLTQFGAMSYTKTQLTEAQDNAQSLKEQLDGVTERHNDSIRDHFTRNDIVARDFVKKADLKVPLEKVWEVTPDSERLGRLVISKTTAKQYEDRMRDLYRACGFQAPQ